MLELKYINLKTSYEVEFFKYLRILLRFEEIFQLKLMGLHFHVPVKMMIGIILILQLSIEY